MKDFSKMGQNYKGDNVFFAFFQKIILVLLFLNFLVYRQEFFVAEKGSKKTSAAGENFFENASFVLKMLKKMKIFEKWTFLMEKMEN